MKLRVAAVSIGCALLSGCMNESENTITPTPSIPLQVISEGSQTGITNQQLHVVRNATELSALVATASFSAPVPSVDFAANNVVAVFIGFGSGCEGVKVTGATENADARVVNVEKTVPGPNIGCIASIPVSGPYVLATISNSTKPVSFSFSVRTAP